MPLPFRLPTFPIKCNIWHAFDPGTSNYAAPDIVGALVNMTPGKRVYVIQPSITVSADFQMSYTQFLFEPLQDVRPFIPATGTADIVECPQGSQLFYFIRDVQDIGKGFANEHRMAIGHLFVGDTTFADTGPLAFPVPMP